MSATHAATPRTMPARLREARLREALDPSSIQRPPSSEGSPASCAEVPSSMEAPPLSNLSRLWRFTRLTCGFQANRTEGAKARLGPESESVKFVIGSLTRERSTSPARRSPARPADSRRTRAVVLDLDESSPKRVSSMPASSSASPSPVPEASSSTRRKRGTAQQASARATRWTAGSGERQRRPRSVKTTSPDRPATRPKSLALASRLRKAPLRTPL